MSLPLYVKLLTPSSGIYFLNKHYLVYTSTMSQSDSYTALPRLPSSVQTGASWTRYRSPKFRYKQFIYPLWTSTPTRQYALTLSPILNSDFQEMKPLVPCDVDYFEAHSPSRFRITAGRSPSPRLYIICCLLIHVVLFQAGG